MTIYLDQIKKLIKETQDKMREELDRQMFQVDPFLAALPKPTKSLVIKRKIRFYFYNWFGAIKGIGYAIIGRDVIPERDDYYD